MFRFASCVRARGAYARSDPGERLGSAAFPFPFWLREVFPFPLPSKVLSSFSWLYRYSGHFSMVCSYFGHGQVLLCSQHPSCLVKHPPYPWSSTRPQWPRGPTALRALGLRSADPAARRPRHQPHMPQQHGNSASKWPGTAALWSNPRGISGRETWPFG